MTTQTEVKDQLGNTVGVGDIIAVGFREGNTGSLRVGRVVDFGSKKRYPASVTTLKVDWSEFNGYDKITQIESDNGRFVKVILPLDTAAQSVV